MIGILPAVNLFIRRFERFPRCLTPGSVFFVREIEEENSPFPVKHSQCIRVRVNCSVLISARSLNDLSKATYDFSFPFLLSLSRLQEILLAIILSQKFSSFSTSELLVLLSACIWISICVREILFALLFILIFVIEIHLN